ncbi:MAG: nucleoside 2-deoxyribosyltransferase [Armatimonadetes bacterium]|nr:nucleoside 2-deoxyribosyltransferase [Armatimonadota bacterium]
MEDFQGKCFVIQPFNETFNIRYRDVFEPAIRAADLEPYRVDRDLSVTVPIDSIQQEIREAKICLADITLDNPNVWYELGYAHALNKDVVMLCGKEREREGKKYPFDVQHLTITGYELNSYPAYEELRQIISNRLKALIRKQEGIEQIVQSPLQPLEGLHPSEVTALALVLENSMTSAQGADFEDVERGMHQAGINKLASGLALRNLVRMRLVDCLELHGEFGHIYKSYLPTAGGEEWLLQNRSKLQLEVPAPAPRPIPSGRKTQMASTHVNDDDFDDADPFADE